MVYEVGQICLVLFNHMNLLENSTPLSEFGLYLFRPHREEPNTAFALQCLPKQELGSSLPPFKKEYCVFISDQGCIYPPALQKWQISLSQFLIIQTDTARQVWKVTLEALQTGLFRWIFLRPSQSCPVSHLRRLQIESKKRKTSIFLFSKAPLPHWFFKKVPYESTFITENLIFSKTAQPDPFR